MIKVRVPASTANLGSGFDCMGIALKLYNTAEFEETDGGLEINILDETKKNLPTDENNYIYRAMKRVFDRAGIYPKGIRISIKNDIPITRGLGSSSACLALGLVGGKIHYTKTEVDSKIKFAAMIPNFHLATKKARSILPRKVFHRSAVYNVSHAAYFASAVAKGDFSSFSIGVKDKLHQKYRFGLIKSAEYIIRSSKRFGALCGYLSGAGPTIISVLDGNYDDYCYKMNNLIETNLKDWHLLLLEADNDGVIAEII